MPDNDTMIHLKLIIATLFWALTPIFGRLLAGYSAPYALAFGRFVVATAVLWVFLQMTGERTRISRAHLGAFTWLGLTGVCLHNVLVFMGVEHTAANRANVIFATITIMIAMIDLAWYRQRLRLGLMSGIGLGILGTTLVVTNGAPWQLLNGAVSVGDGLILLSAASWALYSVLGRPLLQIYSPLTVTFYAALCGTVMLAPFVALDWAVLPELLHDPKALAMIAFLGVLNSAVGFLWYYQAVAKIGAVVTSAYINLVPIFGLGLSALLLGELPNSALLLGGSLVLLALVLINRYPPAA
jgi:drug/metabolite transporter (DMT)-like permease